VKNKFWLAILFGLTPWAWSAECPTRQAKTADTLVAIEHGWAQALAHHDVASVDCILADEFEDAGVEGELSNRNQTLARIPQRKPGSNQLSEMKAHIHGEMGYVRGLNTVINGEGKAVARVRFTDIFVYRDGRWLAVAGHETLLPELQ
jgi:hypothetical protein